MKVWDWADERDLNECPVLRERLQSESNSNCQQPSQNKFAMCTGWPMGRHTCNSNPHTAPCLATEKGTQLGHRHIISVEWWAIRGPLCAQRKRKNGDNIGEAGQWPKGTAGGLLWQEGRKVPGYCEEMKQCRKQIPMMASALFPLVPRQFFCLE